MSNNTKKVFVPGSFITEKTFDNGGSILKVGIAVDKFIEFIQANKKSNGYINLLIQARREPDERSTHTMTLDTWEPSNKSAAQTPEVKNTVKSVKSLPKQTTKSTAPAPVEDDEF